MFYAEDVGDREENEEEWTCPIKQEFDLVRETSNVHNRAIVHIDIDCFYAQVEMLLNPDLRTKPLGIQQKNIIVTCNYIARERGLKKLMYIKDAKIKCPDLVIVNGEDLTKYRDASGKINDFLAKYTPLVEKLGFDENFIDVTKMTECPPWSEMLAEEVQGYRYGEDGEECSCGCSKRLLIASHICAEIRKGLFEELGRLVQLVERQPMTYDRSESWAGDRITSCGGISYNKMLAKLAGATHKPNQQTTLLPGRERAFMVALGAVRNVPGIGHATSKKLSAIGIHSISDLIETPLHTVAKELGSAMAKSVKLFAIGFDESEVVPTGKPQSMSDEDSFKKCDSLKDAKNKIQELVKNLLNRLITDGRIPHTLRLTIRRFDPKRKYFGKESRQCPIEPNIFSKFSQDRLDGVAGRLVNLSMGLLTKMLGVNAPFHLTLINVCLTKFVEKQMNGHSRIGEYFGASKLQHAQETDNSVREITEDNVLGSKRIVTTKKPSESCKEIAGIESSNTNSRYLRDNDLIQDQKEMLELDKRCPQPPYLGMWGKESSESSSNKAECGSKQTITKFFKTGTNNLNSDTDNFKGNCSDQNILDNSANCCRIKRKGPENMDNSDSKRKKTLEDSSYLSNKIRKYEVDDKHKANNLERNFCLHENFSDLNYLDDEDIDIDNDSFEDHKSTLQSHLETSPKHSILNEKELKDSLCKSGIKKECNNSISRNYDQIECHRSDIQQTTSKDATVNLPPHIDKSVFLQLPADIQKSVLNEIKVNDVHDEFIVMKTSKSPKYKNKSVKNCKSIDSFFRKGK